MKKIKIMMEDLPLCVKGVTVEKDNIYYIVINSNYGFEGRYEILKEELEKIENFSVSDFDEKEIKIG